MQLNSNRMKSPVYPVASRRISNSISHVYQNSVQSDNQRGVVESFHVYSQDSSQVLLIEDARTDDAFPEIFQPQSLHHFNPTEMPQEVHVQSVPTSTPIPQNITQDVETNKANQKNLQKELGECIAKVHLTQKDNIYQSKTNTKTSLQQNYSASEEPKAVTRKSVDGATKMRDFLRNCYG